MGVGGARRVSCGLGGGRGIANPSRGIHPGSTSSARTCAIGCMLSGQKTALQTRKHILSGQSVGINRSGKTREIREAGCASHGGWQAASRRYGGTFFGVPAGAEFATTTKAAPFNGATRCHRRRVRFAGHPGCMGNAQRSIANPFPLTHQRDIFTFAVAHCGEGGRSHLHPGSHVSRRIRSVPPNVVSAFREHQSGSLQSLP